MQATQEGDGVEASTLAASLKSLEEKLAAVGELSGGLQAIEDRLDHVKVGLGAASGRGGMLAIRQLRNNRASSTHAPGPWPGRILTYLQLRNRATA